MTRLIALTLLTLAACTTTSAVMPTEDGGYLISAAGSQAVGGATGATAAAFSEATKFCGAQGTHPVVIATQDRDTYSSAGGFGFDNGTGWGSGGMMAGGNAQLRFRCVR